MVFFHLAGERETIHRYLAWHVRNMNCEDLREREKERELVILWRLNSNEVMDWFQSPLTNNTCTDSFLQ